MAEFVQHRLEEGLPELKEMQKAGIFTGKEIKVIVKKRTVFEYRLERRTKCKDDFLKFIKYEISLLRLLSLRRKRLGISVDYTVDFAITNRINVLFRKAIIRFPSDVKLWLSNIEFCKGVRWFESVSRLYAGMLRVHSDKPDIWVAAAKFEIESTKSAATARNLFLRGLRFHPDSKMLYLEYFNMELINAEMKRETLKMTIKKSKGDCELLRDLDVECRNDPVLSGAVALAVYRNAFTIVADAAFASSFLDICRTFKFSNHIQEEIYKDLEVKFANDENARAALAIRPLSDLSNSKLIKKTGPFKNAEDDCFQRFEKAVLDLPTEKMWTLCIDFCLERVDLNGGKEVLDSNRIRVLNLFSRADQLLLLPANYYIKWVHLAHVSDHEFILKSANKRFPDNIVFWQKRISHSLSIEGTRPKRISALFDRSLKSVPDSKSFPIRQLSLFWHMVQYPDKVVDIFEKEIAKVTSTASVMKTRYLEWVFTTKGIVEARKLYQRLWSAPPITLDFFYVACDIEISMPIPSIKRLRRVMDAACRNYGSSNVDLWLRYTNIESCFDKDISRVGDIHWRAVKTLEPHLADQFVAHRTLTQNNVK